MAGGGDFRPPAWLLMLAGDRCVRCFAVRWQSGAPADQAPGAQYPDGAARYCWSCWWRAQVAAHLLQDGAARPLTPGDRGEAARQPLRRRRDREVSYEALCEHLPGMLTESLSRYGRFPTQARMAERLGAADEASVRRLLRDHSTSWSALKREYQEGGEEALRAHLEAHRLPSLRERT